MHVVFRRKRPLPWLGCWYWVYCCFFRILITLNFFILLFYAYGCFACVHFYASCVCLVPSDTRSTCWGLNLVLQEQPVLLTTELYFQPQLLIMCVGVYTLWQVPEETRVISFPGVGVTAVMSILKWVPGIELRFSLRERLHYSQPDLLLQFSVFIVWECVYMDLDNRYLF